MIINLPDLRPKFSSDNYYRATKSIINKISKHLGWDNNIIDTDLYEQHHDDIIRVLLENYTIRNTDMLGAKMASLYYPMKLSGYAGEFIDKKSATKLIPITPNPLDKNTMPWADMKQLLIKNFTECPHQGGKVIAMTYYHGYPLRCGEIANTSIIDTPEFNYLDMEGLRWYIREELTKNRRARSFPVTQEFVTCIKKLVTKKDFLVGRKCGLPYAGNFTLRSVGLSGFTVNDVRNSYETMNYKRKINYQDKVDTSVNVLGHTANTAIAHYTPKIVINKKLDKPLPPPKDVEEIEVAKIKPKITLKKRSKPIFYYGQ